MLSIEALCQVAQEGKTDIVSSAIAESEKYIFSTKLTDDDKMKMISAAANNAKYLTALAIYKTLAYAADERSSFFDAARVGDIKKVKLSLKNMPSSWPRFDKRAALCVALAENHLLIAATILAHRMSRPQSTEENFDATPDIKHITSEENSDENIFIRLYCATRAAAFAINRFTISHSMAVGMSGGVTVVDRVENTLHQIKSKLPQGMASPAQEINEELLNRLRAKIGDHHACLEPRAFLQAGAETGLQSFIDYALAQGVDINTTFDQKFIDNSTARTKWLSSVPDIQLPTAAHLAVQNGQLAALVKLCEAGANVLQTATYYSYRQENYPLTEVALTLDNLHKKLFANLSLIEAAVYSGFPDIADYLWETYLVPNGDCIESFTAEDVYRLQDLIKCREKLGPAEKQQWKELYEKTLAFGPPLDDQKQLEDIPTTGLRWEKHDVATVRTVKSFAQSFVNAVTRIRFTSKTKEPEVSMPMTRLSQAPSPQAIRSDTGIS